MKRTRSESAGVLRLVAPPAVSAAWALAVAAGGAAGAGGWGGERGSELCREARLEWWALRGNLDALEERSVAHFDPDTGRALLNFPPDRVVDYRHMRLEIDIDDMNDPRFDAVQRLRFVPIAETTETLRLDAHLMTVRGVSMRGRELGFTHDGEELLITLDPPVERGREAEIEIRYTLQDPPDGLFWTPESDAWPGRPAQIHTQGQPETNSYWFPCHDFPNERLTTELVVTVPEGFEVSSNGRLLSREPGGPGRETFHWLQTPDHPNYLVTLVIGKFDIVDLGTPELPAPVYVPEGRAGDVEGTYGNTMEMVRVFERLLDEPYPWDRYAQLVVWNFGAGGMENTSASTMFDTAIYEADALDDHDLDGLISHELAHQWFGDLITCRSWQHIWLNEGWATYMESLWFEHRDGREGYDADVLANFDSVIRRDKPEWPYQEPMASRQYRHPWEVFRRESNPYPKGASTLHMLRRHLGDEVFFAGVRAYVDEYKLDVVETDDFRRSMEAASGESLERFFHQWCFRPGVPTLEIDAAWEGGDGAGELTLRVEQTQNIDAQNPAFWFVLPVHVYAGDDSGPEVVMIETDRRSTEVRVPLGAAPRMVAVDPDLHLLAGVRVEQPAERWLLQLADGPTPASRVQAARHLVDRGGPDAASALERAAMDSEAPRVLRREAVKALGKRGDARALTRLIGASVDDAYVRMSLVEAARGMGERAKGAQDDTGLAAAGELLDQLERDADSVVVRGDALSAIGALGLTDRIGVVVAAAEVDSQSDRVRRGALRALGDLGLADGFEVAERYTRPGVLNRTRAIAIDAMVKLAEHDPHRAFDRLVEILETERERRSITAAGRGLVDLGDPRGVAVLERRAASARDRLEREQAEDWAEALREAIAERTEG